MTHKLKTETFSQKIEHSGGVLCLPLTPLFGFVTFHLKDEPILKGFCEVNKTIINSIRIYITDALGKIINLNKVDTSFTFILKDNIII